MKRIMLVIIALACLLPAFSNGYAETQECPYQASTSWTAAFASVATGQIVPSIAPAELKHPPEYEITPSDIARVAGARLFVIAGYERMMQTIADASTIEQEKVIKVTTQNTLDRITEAVVKIAKAAGTEAIAQKNLERFESLFSQAREEVVKQGLDKLRCYVNINQEPLARDIGLNVAGTFGPGPVTAQQIKLVSDSKFDIIIDNIHNPVADPFTSVSHDSVFLTWRNFPEETGPDALYKVIEENLKALI